MKTAICFVLAIAALLAWDAPRPAMNSSVVESSMTGRILVKGVSRFGINLGGWSFWGADQLSSNILKNPGFEGLLDSAIVIPVHTGNGSFDDSPAWLARPDGFWEGARYCIRTGLNAGKEGTVVHSSLKNYWGLPSFVVRDGGAIPNPGDVVALVLDRETERPTQWWYSSDPGNSFRSELNQTRPGSPGMRSLRVVAGSAARASVSSYFDSIGERAGKMLPLGGRWNLSFWVRLDKGKASLDVQFGRQGSSPILSRTVALHDSWQQIQLAFDSQDSGPVGTANLIFQVAGLPFGEILLDDVDLRKADDAGQPFRHEVTAMLGELHPAYLRDWQGQLGDTLANRISSGFARKSYRYRPGDDGQTDYPYGLADFLALCRQIHAAPWIIIPTVFNDADCIGLGEYLAKQPPLQAGFETLVEFGNENWNSLFRPGGVPDAAAHGEAAGRCFALIRQHAHGLPLKTVINAQAGYPDGAMLFARQSSLADIVAVAPYFYYSVPAGLTISERIALLFKPGRKDLQTIAEALPPLHKELSIYEVNLHTIEGDAAAGERRPIVGGIASGAALARTMLDALTLGVRRQCAYSFLGFEARLTSQPGYIPLWGMARDAGPTKRFRPTGLALELLNEALRGDMVSMDTRGPEDVSTYAFRTATDWAVVFVSSSLSNRKVTFTLPAASSTKLRLDRLVSDTIDSTNEDAEHVRIERATISGQGNHASFELSPLSTAVLLPQ
jgi:hypothetical protein